MVDRPRREVPVAAGLDAVDGRLAGEEHLVAQVGERQWQLGRELARAQMIGDERGLLKLLFDPDTLRLLGVHVMGESATEIIHIGQAVLSMGGTIDYFRDTVFNYPTLAEAYKVAALNGMNKV